MKCPCCDEEITKTFVLYDKDKIPCGEFCSRKCARSDAWGPRFWSYTIQRKAS